MSGDDGLLAPAPTAPPAGPVAEPDPVPPPEPPEVDRPPITAGSLLRRTLQVWWRNLGKLTLMMLLLVAPMMILFIGLWRVFDPRPGRGGTPFTPFLNLAAFGLLMWPVMALILGGISHGTIQWLAGQRAGVVAMLGQGGRRLWPLLLACLLLFLAIAGGYVLLVVPGVMVAVAASVTIPAVAVERLGPLAGFRRSLELTRGHRWPVFGAFLGMMLVLFSANVLVQGMLRSAPVIGALLSLASSLLFTSIPYVLPAVAYHDLRVAKEGVDTSQLARVFE